MTEETTAPLTPAEWGIAAACLETCDLNDWAGCATWTFLPEITKAQRQMIRSLVARGHMAMTRGGTDEDGQLIGGTFYHVTSQGRAALAWTPQRELPL
ncbi:MAG: hypothetical protein KYX69_19835 [Sphingomonas sp.]|uniref:hypothetical protein n=1 Tax=Sphingomonas sp. TaxID=28214 RepID=UPI0026369C41|nr:hypothetical protein [Sphingomonas sp.]MDK2769956.1 hypothetical protein [Sphingomonas sp.]